MPMVEQRQALTIFDVPGSLLFRVQRRPNASKVCPNGHRHVVHNDIHMAYRADFLRDQQHCPRPIPAGLNRVLIFQTTKAAIQRS